jgi:hypothetical protein
MDGKKTRFLLLEQDKKILAQQEEAKSHHEVLFDKSMKADPYKHLFCSLRDIRSEGK